MGATQANVLCKATQDIGSRIRLEITKLMIRYGVIYVKSYPKCSWMHANEMTVEA